MHYSLHRSIANCKRNLALWYSHYSGHCINTRVPELQFVHGVGSTWTQQFFFQYFPVGISVRNLQDTCIHPRQEKIRKKYRLKMVVKKRIFISRKQSRDQNLKDQFSKEIFNKIWLKWAWIHFHCWNKIKTKSV